MLKTRWLQPFFSTGENGGGGDSGGESAFEFDDATNELMGLLAPNQELGEDGADVSAMLDEVQREGVDIPEDIEFFDIPVESGADYESVKEDILDEIRRLIPKEAEDEESLEVPNEEVNTEEFMNRYMENPLEAVRELADKIAEQRFSKEMEGLKQQLAPVMQQAQQLEKENAVKQVLTEFMTNPEFEDAGEFVQEMAEFINQNDLPKDDIRSYNDAYFRAKTSRLQGSQGKSLNDYLGDDEAVNQIASNESIKQKIIGEYLKQIAEGGKPVTLGSDSYSPAAAPAVNLDSLEDAGAALLKKL